MAETRYGRRFDEAIKRDAMRRLEAGTANYSGLAREIGCSAKAVRKWYDAHVKQNGGKRVVELKVPVQRRYSDEVRAEAVRRVMSGELSMQAMARQLGAHHSLLQYWIRQAGEKPPAVRAAPVERPRVDEQIRETLGAQPSVQQLITRLEKAQAEVKAIKAQLRARLLAE